MRNLLVLLCATEGLIVTLSSVNLVKLSLMGVVFVLSLLWGGSWLV